MHLYTTYCQDFRMVGFNILSALFFVFLIYAIETKTYLISFLDVCYMLRCYAEIQYEGSTILKIKSQLWYEAHLRVVWWVAVNFAVNPVKPSARTVNMAFGTNNLPLKCLA